MDDVTQYLDSGGFAVLALAALYLIKWLTTKFNGSIATLTEAMKENTAAALAEKEVSIAIAAALGENTKKLIELSEREEHRSGEMLKLIENITPSLVQIASDIAKESTERVIEELKPRTRRKVAAV